MFFLVRVNLLFQHLAWFFGFHWEGDDGGNNRTGVFAVPRLPTYLGDKALVVSCCWLAGAVCEAPWRLQPPFRFLIRGRTVMAWHDEGVVWCVVSSTLLAAVVLSFWADSGPPLLPFSPRFLNPMAWACTYGRAAVPLSRVVPPRFDGSWAGRHASWPVTIPPIEQRRKKMPGPCCMRP